MNKKPQTRTKEEYLAVLQQRCMIYLLDKPQNAVHLIVYLVKVIAAIMTVEQLEQLALQPIPAFREKGKTTDETDALDRIRRKTLNFSKSQIKEWRATPHGRKNDS